jgi:hypothetical protein
MSIMWCLGAFIAIVLAFLNPLGWWSWTDEEPAWGRRLGDWWERHFPSREERERRRRGFDVKVQDKDHPDR